MPDFGLEAELWSRGYQHVAGVDEAGRGPLAGPVVAAAVILAPDWTSRVPLDDSKRLSEAKRETAFEVIRNTALAWKVALAQPEEIDQVNILQATLRAMARAVERLKPRAEVVLVDGNHVPRLGASFADVSLEAVIKGDGRSTSIAAASILAKVVRDRIMAVYGERYPEWGFAAHKGYGTKAHREALRRHGPSPIHRASFRVKDVPWQATRPSEERENPLLPGILKG
jgi:ribonuclease HII